jgi:hypothetical protein
MLETRVQNFNIAIKHISFWWGMTEDEAIATQQLLAKIDNGNLELGLALGFNLYNLSRRGKSSP